MARANIILGPRVDGNPSDKYRVVRANDWLLYRRGLLSKYKFTAYDTYKQAQQAADGKS
jgi:hypothetical protein